MERDLWELACISHFRNGNASEDDWQKLGEIMCFHSETSGIGDDLEETIDEIAIRMGASPNHPNI